ncbi:MAG TPA: hypothetical protein VLH08_01990 [Acidobacteriota bacterium]|nr:hypothetical protein [Acidobacteriota bacterium]
MIRNLKYAVVVLMLSIACAGAHMQTTERGLPQEYFPLKTGLYWKYRYQGLPRGPVDVEVRVEEQKEINGKQYYRLSTWFTLTRNVPSGETWVSWSDGNVYLSDGKSENVVIGPGIEKTELKKNDPSAPVETPAGKFDDVLKFQDCLGCADSGTQYSLARGKGTVLVTMSAIWGSAQYELIETNAP